MSRDRTPEVLDAVIVGGSYAGMSAGLQLARARRSIMVVDAGVPRNRHAAQSHGFLGHDGRSPAAINAAGREQLCAYPTVRWVRGTVADAQPDDDGFVVSLNDGQRARARRVVLAMGVTDELPAVEGVPERWGRSVFHCPYCHGYELQQGRIGVLAVGASSMHHALMLPDWGTVTLFTNGAMDLDAEQRAALARRHVAIERTRVVRLVDHASVELVDGRVIELDGLFTASRTSPSGTIAGQLGCAMDAGATGPFIWTSPVKATSVPGVFACGDAARGAGSVALAVGDGALAGTATHQSLIFGST